jgi:SAM-dependent methyltransferase
LSNNLSIDSWIDILRHHVQKNEPLLIDIFEIYAAEAKFGRLFIDENLKKIPNGGSILEIGAGAMILSCQLVIEGFSVTSLEPIGKGFSHFDNLRRLVLNQAAKIGCEPKLFFFPAENLIEIKVFDFAFSVNVMEHVESQEQVINRIFNSLKIGGIYRFTCPNYLFPYEPHFNIPILFNKSLTWFFFKNKILRKKNVPDAIGLWKSLNWISVFSIKKCIPKTGEVKAFFDTKAIVNSFERVLQDQEFASRRSSWVRFLIKYFVYLKLHKVFSYLPIFLHPIIDCSLTKLK